MSPAERPTRRALVVEDHEALRDGIVRALASRFRRVDREGHADRAVERLLDPDNVSVTLLTLARAARALGKRIRIEVGAECSPRVARAASAKQTPLE